MPAEDRVAEFAFASGTLRGTWLTLYPTRLLHEGGDRMESIPLSAVAAVRVAFERQTSAICWGAVLVVIALAAYAVSGPLAAMAHAASVELAGNGGREAGAAQSGTTGLLVASFRGFEGAARLMPLAAAALAAWGVALAVLGWRGLTTLTLLFAAAEREFPVRGRNALLFDFAESVNQGIAQLR